MASTAKHVRFHLPDACNIAETLELIRFSGIKFDQHQKEVPKELKSLKNNLKQNNLELLNQITTLLFDKRDKWNNDDVTLWEDLSQRDIHPETVAKTLFLIMEEETSFSTILAATSYFCFLQIPGSFLYHVYDALIVTLATKLMKKWLFTFSGTKSLALFFFFVFKPSNF